MLRREDSKKVDYIQEQLAEIYISPTKKKELPDRNKKENLKSGWVSLTLALGIMLLALLIFLLSVYRIDVNVMVIREPRPVRPDAAAGSGAEVEPFNMAGFPDTTISFNGSAGTESELTEQYLHLVNARGPGWANAQIDFAKPLNAADNTLSLSAKGARGGEILLIILTDTDGKTYQAINIAPDGLNNGWRNYKIRLDKAARSINTGSISRIKLEFGSMTANNPIGAAIYIKGLSLNRERRI